MSPKRIVAIVTLACLASAVTIFMVSTIALAGPDNGNGDPKLSIDPTSGIISVDPGNDAEFTITVLNDGDTDNFYATITWDDTKDWVVEPSWTNESLGEIRNDKEKTFVVTLTPNDDPYVDKGESLRVNVEVFTRYPSGDKSNSDTVRPKANCNQVYKLDTDVEGDSIKDVDPGVTASFNLNITNIGNGEDTFKFSLDDSTPLENGWAISLPTPLTLDRDVYKIVSVKLKAADKASSGEHWYNIIVTSSGNENQYGGEQLTVNVSEDYNFIVTAKDGNNQINVDPDGTATFSATFENTGNDKDEYNLDVDDSNKPDGWSYTLNQESTPTISAGKLNNLTNFLSVTAPVDYVKAPANSFWLVTINATSEANPLVKKTAVFKTVINQVFDVEVSANNSAKWIEEGGTVYYNFVITNNGNGEDTIKVEITGDKAEWGDLNTPASVVLKRKGSGENIAYANVSVSVPEGTEESSTGYKLNLTVTSEDTTEKSNSRVSIKVRQNFDIRAEVFGATLSYINEEESGVFKLRFTNKGNGEDTILITAGGDEPGWASIPGSVTTKQDEAKDVTLTVTVPKDQELGTYNITITGTSDEDTSVPPASASVTVTIKVNQTYEVGLSFPKNTHRVNVEESTIFDFIVTNDGTGPDKIILDTEDLPSGWTRKFSEREINLNSSESKDMTLTIEVPEDTAREDFSINVTATSFGNSTIFAISKIIVSVNQSYDFTMDKEPPTRTANPGQTVQFKVTINNEGTGTDRIDVSVEEKPNYWTVDDLSPITIQISTSVSRFINVTIPENATNADYKIKLKGTSLEDPNSKTYSIDFTVSVNKFYNFSVAIVGTTKSIDPGYKVNFTFTIENKGNFVDTYSFTETGLLEQWEPSYKPSPVSIEPKQSKEVNLQIYIPLEETQRTENIQIKVISDGNALKTQSFSITVIVNQTYDLDISADPAVQNIKPENNAFVEYDITVNNTGTGTDSFTFELTPDVPSGWSFSLAANTGDINADDEITKVLKINIPNDNVPGDFYFNVSATSDRRKTISKKTPVLVKVLEIYEFALTIDEAIQGIYPGEFAIFEYDLKNTGTSKDKINFELSKIPSGWEAPYSSYVEVNVSETKTIKLNVSVDDDQTALDYKIWLNGTSEEEPTYTQSAIITVHVKQRYEVQLSIATATIIARPDEDISFNFQMSNTGTGVDDFSFIAVAPEGWTLTLPLRVNDIAVGESLDNLYVNVTIPDNILPAIYMINLTARSEGSKEGDIYIVTTDLELFIDLRQKYDVDITPDEKTITLHPGKSTYVNLTVKNKGTGPDVFDVYLTGDNRTEGQITYPENESLYLRADETGYINISFEADNLEDKWIWEIIVNAKSTKEDYDGNVIDSTTINVDIQPYYNVTYVIDALKKKARPGQETVGSVEYTVNAKNKGTGQDTLTMKILKTAGTQWEWASWPSGTPSDIVAPNSIGPDHILKVDVPAGTRKGIYSIEVEIKSSKDPTKSEIIPIEVDVQRYTQFDVVFLEPISVKNNPGEDAVFKVKITNKGNSKENFTMETDEDFGKPDEFETIVYDPDDAVVELDINENMEILLTITTDPDATPQLGGYSIPMIVYSKTNLSDMGGERSKIEMKYGNFTVNIQPRYSLTLEGTQSSFDADPGKIVEITLQVKNTGTDDDVVSFSYEEEDLPAGWKITNPGNIDPFQPEITSDVDWEIEIKDKEEKKTFFINFTATMENGTPGDKTDDITDTFMVKFNVQQLFDVELPAYKNLTLDPGISKTINISIKNIGTGVDLFELTLEGKNKDKGDLNIDQLELDANEKGYAEIIVTAGEKETDPYWNFSLKVKSLKSLDEVGYDVIKYTYCNIDILAYYEVTYTTEATTQKAWPGRTSSYDVIFELSAINRGTGEDTIEMKIVDGPYSNWAQWVAGSPSDTLDPEEISDPHQLRVRIPSKTSKTEEGREYHIEIIVKSTKDLDATDLIDLEIDVQRYTLFDVTFTAPKVVDNDPGETSTFIIQITNKGNSIENFTSELQPGYIKPEGIKETSYGPSDAIIMLAPEERSQIWVNVTSDPEEAPQSNDVSLMVYSKDNFTDMKGWTGVVRVYDNFTIDLQARHSHDLTATKEAWENVDPDSYIDVILQIENTGTAEDDYSFSYVSNELPSAWTIENPDPITLQSGERQDVSWYLHVFDKEIVGKFYLNFTATSKNGTEDPEDDFTDQKMILFNTRQLFDIEVTKEQLPNIKPGVPIELNFTVENKGSGDDQYSVSMKGDITFIDFVTPEVFSLGAGKKRNITVLIDPPAEPDDKYWWVNITTKSEKSQSEAGYPVEANSFLNITIKAFYKPNILGDTVADADTHGTIIQDYSYNLRIRNDGSGSDTISMAIDKVDPPLKAYWDGSIPWGDTIDADTTGQTQYDLLCEIPPNTAEGSYNVSIWVNSTNDPTKNKLVNFTLKINTFYDISTSILIETVEILLEPPYEAIFKVNITNEGNKKMDLRLKYQTGLEPRWNSDPGTAGRLLQDMESGETRTETITITVDDEADEGVYENIKFKIYPEDSPLDDEEMDFTVEVSELRKIRLQYAAATAGTVEPVDGKNKVALAVDVYNDGNVDDDILLKVNTTEFYANYPEAIKWNELAFYSKEDLENKITSIDVSANDKETVYLGVELPSHVDDRGSVAAGSYIIPIYGESKEDPSANDDEDVPMIIKKVSEVNVEYTGGRKKIDPGETVSFVVKVENYGNEKDEMTFDVIDTYDWGNPVDDFYKMEFNEGEKREIKVNITIPFIDEDDTAEAGNYDIELEVKPKSGGTKVKVPLDFEITESYGCKIELIDTLKNETLPDEGTVITYKAKISNLGNSDANIKVPGIDGASNLSSGDFDKWDVFLETSTSKGKRELDFSIKPTESREITVKVEIHEGGYINTYSMLLRAYPEGKSQYEAYPQRFWLTLREPIYKLLWTDSSRNQNKEVEPEKDTEMEYTVYVENLGTEDDTVTVRVEPLSTDLKGWEVKFRPPGAGEESTTLSEIKIGDGDIQIFTLVVRPEERADRDTYDIELTVESEVDSTATDRLLIQTTVKRPDLEIYAEDIKLPLDVKEGDLAQLRAIVSNVGNAKARDVEITFYDNIGYDGEEIDSTSITIPVGDSVTVTGDWDVGAGKYYITVIVDENEEIVESNEGNNKATAPALDIRQDLVVSNIEITERPEKGETVDVDVTIWNNGSADVNKAEVRLKVGGGEIAKQDVSIISGQKEEISLEWKIPSDEDKDNYKIVIEVDDVVKNIDDANKGDNKESMKITAVEPASLTSGGSFMYIIIILALVVVVVVVIAKKPKGAAPPPRGKLPAKKPPMKGKPGAPPKQKAKGPPGKRGMVPPPPGKPGAPPAKGAQPPGKPGGKSIKCPKCKSPITVSSSERPIKIECKKCGAKGTLKK